MAANLEFTIDEFNVMHNAEFFIHKKNISNKVIKNFSLLDSMIETLKANLLTEKEIRVLKRGKLNRGENYELLPYFILDNPGVFTGNDIFACRIMFWWGNYYSCTLHLSGIYLDLLKGRLERLTEQFMGYYFCNNSEQWQHHFREDNYHLIDGNSFPIIVNHLNQNGFFKIAFKRPLTEYENFEKEVLVFLNKVFIELQFKSQ